GRACKEQLLQDVSRRGSARGNSPHAFSAHAFSAEVSLCELLVPRGRLLYRVYWRDIRLGRAVRSVSTARRAIAAVGRKLHDYERRRKNLRRAIRRVAEARVSRGKSTRSAHTSGGGYRAQAHDYKRA